VGLLLRQIDNKMSECGFNFEKLRSKMTPRTEQVIYDWCLTRLICHNDALTQNSQSVTHETSINK
jgi:hypothetical protein